ncbi:MAG: DNA translocase FtsK [Clostridia bacterium]|nr:DNA translocase FtsK [Clostridia bacterium]
MDISSKIKLSYSDLREKYKEYLAAQNLSKSSVSTITSDTFFLWNRGSRELFWKTVASEDFENAAKEALRPIVQKNSKGDVENAISIYISDLRKFRAFLSEDSAGVEKGLQSNSKKEKASQNESEAVIVPESVSETSNASKLPDFNWINLKKIVNAYADQEEPGQLIVPIGKIGSDYVFQDFSDIPTMLISGTTGSGKTVFVETLMLEMMQKYYPEDVRFILFTSKGVDYQAFENNPFLYIPLLSDAEKASKAIRWVLAEVKYRLSCFDRINSLPHIIVVLDDFSCLASWVQNDLAELFRSSIRTKVHCWIITSTPTTTVISTELKAIIPTRVAFHVSEKRISRLVIDEPGAEMLRVPGEMIFKHFGNSKRLNAVHLTDSEMMFLGERANINYPKHYIQQEIWDPSIRVNSDDLGDKDILFAAAGFTIIEMEKATIGLLQRKFKIGFNQAARIMDQLAEEGVVGPEEGTKARQILMTRAQFEELLDGHDLGYASSRNAKTNSTGSLNRDVKSVSFHGYSNSENVKDVDVVDSISHPDTLEFDPVSERKIEQGENLTAYTDSSPQEMSKLSSQTDSSKLGLRERIESFTDRVLSKFRMKE